MQIMNITSLRVTPFAGVWIEIGVTTVEAALNDVTPFAGVWIEIVHVPR